MGQFINIAQSPHSSSVAPHNNIQLTKRSWMARLVGIAAQSGQQ